MSKATDALSQRLNQFPVGLKGGKKVSSDLNNSDANRIKSVVDRDNDGIPDRSVTVELSEDWNAKLLKGK